MNSFLQAPHLVSMFMALGLASSVLIGFDRYATGVENRYVRALSPLMFIQKGQGRALQRAAFQRHDLLPVYGSSELLNQRAYQRPYNAKVLLEAFPTGFTIFPIGKAETSDLIFLQKLAAVGGSARGKKVVISLTPVWFFNRGEMMDPDSYGGNFSRLQAYELAFSGELSLDVKRRAARRMLDYPGTLASDPLLRFALDSLADFTPAGRCRYALAFPLGKLQTVVFGLQDHWEVLGYIQGRPGLKSSVAQRIADPDWPALKARAIELYREHSSNNPFGFDNDRWLDGYRQKAAEQQAERTEANFLADLAATKEWTDLTLLLRGLKELGAEPLILSAPMHGPFFESCGISPRIRQIYYDRLRALAAEFDAGLEDFADHDGDRDFQIDFGGHLSPKGWVYYAEAMNDFFHRPSDSRRFMFARSARSGSEIPKEARRSARESPPAADQSRAECRGSLDRADIDQIAGWAWNPGSPNAHIEVLIFDNGRLMATVPADRFRRDLVHVTRDSGKHGFVFPSPPGLKDGRTHLIQVMCSGSATELAKSPRTIQTH